MEIKGLFFSWMHRFMHSSKCSCGAVGRRELGHRLMLERSSCKEMRVSGSSSWEASLRWKFASPNLSGSDLSGTVDSRGRSRHVMSPPQPQLIPQVVSSWDEKTGPLYLSCDHSLGVGCPGERDMTLGKMMFFSLDNT